jgi:integral membrane protein
MAFVVGTGLALLCFVGIPLQIIGDNKWPWTAVVEIVGPIHGIFYIVYLLTCLDLAGRARFRTTQLLGMVGSGLVPLLAFYMERKVTERVQSQLALGADAPPGPAATIWAVLSGTARRPPQTSRGPLSEATLDERESSAGAQPAVDEEVQDEAAPARASGPSQPREGPP